LLENIAHMFVYQGVTDETCGCAAPRRPTTTVDNIPSLWHR